MVWYLKIVLCVLVLSLVTDVFCIRCWICQSSYDAKCGETFDNSTFPLTDCDGQIGLDHLPGVKSTMCRKIRQKVNGEWRYIRDCAYQDDVGTTGDEMFCHNKTKTFSILVEYCTCNGKDGCNA